jgi:hypothetical protein
MIPAHYAIKLARGLERKKLGLDNGKKRKKAMGDDTRKSMMQMEALVISSRDQSISSPALDSDAADQPSRPIKRRRLCTDLKMAQVLDDGNVFLVGLGRSSRSKSGQVASESKA